MFQGELKKTMEHYGVWCAKFPDSIKTAGTRFIPTKPADLIAVCNRTPFLIECKMIKKIGKINYKFFGSTKEKKENLSFSEFRQVKELNKFRANCGYPAFYAINVRVERKYNVLLFFEVSEMEQMFRQKDHISRNELLEHIDLGIRGHKGLFTGEQFEGFLMYAQELKNNLLF